MHNLIINRPQILVALSAIGLIGVSLLTLAGNAKRLSEPVEIDANSETFGARFVVRGETLGLKKAVKDAECTAGKPVTIKTQVSEVCQAKGCFFIANEDDFYTRVTFQDYSFFVPTDISGKQVLINAVLNPRVIETDDLEHLQADLGKNSQLFAQGPLCELTAQSVKVLN